jgi:DNA-binding cell septation regulator SpoVG
MIYKFTDEQKEEQKMQTSITKISMRLHDENAEVKVYASIVINGSVKINGIKIISNRDGKILVVLPEDSEKKIQYVVPMNNYFRQYLDTTLVERYFKLKSALNKTATKGFDPNG